MTESLALAQAAVSELVERFRRNLEDYQRSAYKEAEVRGEFIDSLVEALGWDVRNLAGYAEQYKDVVQEESLRVGAAWKTFDGPRGRRIGGPV